MTTTMSSSARTWFNVLIRGFKTSLVLGVQLCCSSVVVARDGRYGLRGCGCVVWGLGRRVWDF